MAALVGEGSTLADERLYFLKGKKLCQGNLP
jgi:hypothetical protein